MYAHPEHAQLVSLATAGPRAPVQIISEEESVPAPARAHAQSSCEMPSASMWPATRLVTISCAFEGHEHTHNPTDRQAPAGLLWKRRRRAAAAGRLTGRDVCVERLDRHVLAAHPRRVQRDLDRGARSHGAAGDRRAGDVLE